MVNQLGLFDRPITNSGIDEENFFLINAIKTSPWTGEWSVVYLVKKGSPENFILVDRCGKEEADQICSCKNVYKKELGDYKVIKTTEVEKII